MFRDCKATCSMGLDLFTRSRLVRDNFSYIADAAHMEIADHLKVLDRFQVSGIFFINLLGEFLNFPCYELGTINDIVTIK